MFNILLILGVALFVSLSLLAFLKFKGYEKQFRGNAAGVLDRRDIGELLRPATIFIAIAISAFSIYYKCGNQNLTASGDRSFKNFIQDVEAGKQQLTTDKAMAIIRQGRVTEDAYRRVIADEAWLIQWMGWLALLGFLLLIIAAFRVRRRNENPVLNTAPASAAK